MCVIVQEDILLSDNVPQYTSPCHTALCFTMLLLHQNKYSNIKQVHFTIVQFNRMYYHVLSILHTKLLWFNMSNTCFTLPYLPVMCIHTHMHNVCMCLCVYGQLYICIRAYNNMLNTMPGYLKIYRLLHWSLVWSNAILCV